MVRSHRGGKLATLMIVVFVAAALSCASKEDRAFGRLEPTLLSPGDGQTIRKYPRTIALEWRGVQGASRYLVEVEMQNPNTGVWMPTPVGTSRQFVHAERIFIEFPGDQPGRWRVTAINSSNQNSRTSDWSHFEFLLP